MKGRASWFYFFLVGGTQGRRNGGGGSCPPLPFVSGGAKGAPFMVLEFIYLFMHKYKNL